MATTDMTVHVNNRGAVRINVNRDHLPTPVAKALDKLEAATTARHDADQALAKCGHGTGPERATFERKAREALRKQEDVLEELFLTAARNSTAVADGARAAYNAAALRFAKAQRDALDALEEASEAAALYACTKANGALLDVRAPAARQDPTRSAAHNLAAQLRQASLPSLAA
ncbi:hypothetical protein [Streptomyces sp. ME19-01-6]|uniref:hypothetical protein n=1 Tax=Streptomyces sp. ME19-01-6 TaxID=3028686 RepID=UPI0029AC4F36|nr:hypothetical protein [Streptomyces sp. ME19-01-6]MDX3229412.1 hypothetical protein [Streptomyces sp. ME19-01-6]